MRLKSYFITGTDTHIGKTWTTVALLTRLRQQGYAPMAIKPLASGCQLTQAGWHNEDALLLQQHNTRPVAYEWINPLRCAPAVAPHLIMPELTADDIIAAIKNSQQIAHDYYLIEGVGGWRVPLNHAQTMADVAIGLKIPVILVVGMRLGCLNHALLTYQAIAHDGLSVRGWVANIIDPAMEKLSENIATLTQRIAVPLLGIINYQPTFNPTAMTTHFDFTVL